MVEFGYMTTYKNKETGTMFISSYHDYFNGYFMSDVGLVKYSDERFEFVDIPAREARTTLPVFK